MTYANTCSAFSAGVGIASEGECEADQQACGGTGGATCAEGEFCKRPAGECEPPVEPVACDGASGGTCAEGEFCQHADGACAADAEGTCTALPLVCQPIVLEVCGCDAVTYPSACFAHGAGINVDYTGPCATSARSMRK